MVCIQGPGRAIAVLAMAMFGAACGAPAGSSLPTASSVAAVPIPSAIAVPFGSAAAASPTATAAPVASATSAPSATPASPTASTTPTAKPAASGSATEGTWSKPRRIHDDECIVSSATIDAAGRHHVAAACGASITYLTSANGTAWTATSFPPPIDLIEASPQLSIDGDRIHIAYSLLDPDEGGCGDDGRRELGVYVRSRSLTGGGWSNPLRLGLEGDRLQAFRVANGVLHATFETGDGRGVVYQASRGTRLSRIEIPRAVSTSLRVGDDGRARIAYATGDAIRLARVDGDRLTRWTVAETDRTSILAPDLVLGPGDRAYVVWTQSIDDGTGCAVPEPPPIDGTYFATNAGSKWTPERLTRSTGGTSLTLDPNTSALHALVAGRAVSYFSSRSGAGWSGVELGGTEDMTSPIVRLDPTTGRLVAFVAAYSGGIFVLGRR